MSASRRRHQNDEGDSDGISHFDGLNISDGYYIVRSAQSSLLELQSTQSHQQPVFMKGSSIHAKRSNIETDKVHQQTIALQKMHISHPRPVQHVAEDYFSPYAPMQDTYIPPSAHDTYGPPQRAVHSKSFNHASDHNSWSPHEHFFFRDGDVLFRISNVLYNLHLNVFGTHSKFFHDLFNALRLTSSPIPNAQKEPIVLSELKVEEFDRFLSILYPTTPDLVRHQRTKEEWLSTLSLSTRWTFPSVRKLAIQQLTQMLSVEEKTLFAGKFGVHEWLAR